LKFLEEGSRLTWHSNRLRINWSCFIISRSERSFSFVCSSPGGGISAYRRSL